jgi:hypothetical protein
MCLELGIAQTRQRFGNGQHAHGMLILSGSDDLGEHAEQGEDTSENGDEPRWEYQG